MIAADARAEREDGDRQVLIVCDVIEHVFALKQMLPDFEVVYAAEAMTPSRIREFKNQRLWPAGHLPMTAMKRDEVTSGFERGIIRGAICNTVWNIGVDFRYLDTTIRADGGASPTNDTQIPGRTARINDKGKVIGRIRDYRDQFDKGIHQRAMGRGASYAFHKWKQYNAATMRPLYFAAAKRKPRTSRLNVDTYQPEVEEQQELFKPPPRKPRVIPTLCAACGLPQFMTPSGLTCANGHGGAPPRSRP